MANKPRLPIEHTVEYSTPWFDLVAKRVGTDPAPYYSLRMQDYVSVVALTSQREIIMVQQYRPAIEERFRSAAAYLGIAGGFDGFMDFVRTLNASLGIPDRLRDLGVENADVDALVADALRDPSVGGNPVALSDAALRGLFSEVL